MNKEAIIKMITKEQKEARKMWKAVNKVADWSNLSNHDYLVARQSVFYYNGKIRALRDIKAKIKAL